MAKSKVVLKFGGTSLASIDCIRNAAEIVKKFSTKYSVVVVASAMAKFTNTLAEYASYFYKVNNNKEYDTVLATGEQISVGLFALALEELNLKASSLLAWQIPIITDKLHANAQILDIPSKNLNDLISKGIIPVVAGFQGVSSDNCLTTLGRGGSDTTAVAIAVAIKAESCYIYTDVDGVFTCDPNMIKEAKSIKEINFPELIEMANSGAKVIHCRATELAFKNNLPLYIKSTFSSKKGTLVKQQGETVVEEPLVNAIVTSKNEVMFTIKNIPKIGNVDLQILNKVLESGVTVDLINKEVKTNSITLYFVISRDNLEIVLKALENNKILIKHNNISFNTEVAKLSVVGVGLQNHPKIMEKIFQIFIKHDINILLMSLANLKLTFVIAEEKIKISANCLYDELKAYFNN